MNRCDTDFPGLFTIELEKIKDNRGTFSSLYSRDLFQSMGIDFHPEEEILYRTTDPNTIYGLSFQKPPKSRSQMYQVFRGCIYLVACDLRKSSPKFKEWYAIELNGGHSLQVLIPEGFATGYLTIKPDTEVLVRSSSTGDPNYSSGIRWDDPDLDINWMVPHPILSKEDLALPYLRDLEDFFP
ncbi:MAG: dTDP-4-dehydrorhamnose 3,5-epimerase family protein [Leptospiraceae bacterium]|nr:dTDP-4-dehydrorhamnose 3,5-epimerase family protein [Leptospiraceae bacterium]MCP5510323.1 dTDP-4-dehydrorhamnose 3,5-epimerase family protein [Leptospiraceae bacterium]